MCSFKFRMEYEKGTVQRAIISVLVVTTYRKKCSTGTTLKFFVLRQKELKFRITFPSDHHLP